MLQNNHDLQKITENIRAKKLDFYAAMSTLDSNIKTAVQGIISKMVISLTSPAKVLNKIKHNISLLCILVAIPPNLVCIKPPKHKLELGTRLS